ncbi:chorismate mutase [Rickettsiales bacterium]|nr:chorismate mutase [Rickettsiales bacterium]
MSDTQNELLKLRKEIDNIDQQIIDLLKDRIEFVKQVGKYKSKTSKTTSFIRSGREADMLRDLTKKIEGKFPAAAIATIWRMIISTSLDLEQKMNIAAYAKGNDNNCYWLAREYYGTFIETKCYESTDEIIQKVARNDASVGILPLFDKSELPWWLRPYDEKNDIYVFARIPFIEHKSDIHSPVLAIANVLPEKTGDDISLFAINGDIEESLIASIITAYDSEFTILGSHKNGKLIEIPLFIDEKDAINHDLQKDFKKNNVQARLLGSYAKPLFL